MVFYDSKTVPENISITKLSTFSSEFNAIQCLLEYIKHKVIKNKLWTSLSEDNIFYKGEPT